ncbi:MAG: DUF58 domain-containing protein [Lentisphaerae bacterium]|jgi:uncharacterized protein (DUF58 family)|nr:DUF58 domain-containing protein [Lentisphaerota bacterium]MBT4815620.1 DUF58 domain-containing protein [Lentisphaerota bacterium]MBT5607457.1 DUF58 domain-containing protein [Lentisphaerota bacterium]MBT7055737.1 DUF58 domain-containing protein [Lentisphaerota bacterium]MBT7843128.1 DUF58 domain-containing protein [Lentisphaerota bacterium]
MITVTWAGAGFAGLAVLLYMASMQATTGLLFLVLGVVFACFMVNAIGAFQSARCLMATPPKVLRGTEGEPLREPWRVSNSARRNAGMASVMSPWGVLLRIAAVPAGATTRIRPVLALPSRGVYAYGRLRLASTYPFGLVRFEKRMDAGGEIVVCPEVYECLAPPASGHVPVLGGGVVGTRRSPSGSYFHGVRPMTAGDPVRLVHWPSSSKGQGLMVKEFDEELAGRIAVLVDCSVEEGAPVLDRAARAAGSVALACLDRGDHVDVVDLGRGELVSVSPFVDSDVVLTALARLEGKGPGTFGSHLEEVSGRLGPRTALCFVLTGAVTEAHDAVVCRLVERGRRVSVCLPDSVGALEWPPEVRVFQYGERSLAPCG